MTTMCYGVFIEGRNPRFYVKLSTARGVVTRYRNEYHGFGGRIRPEPVIKEYIMGMEVRPGG